MKKLLLILSIIVSPVLQASPKAAPQKWVTTFDTAYRATTRDFLDQSDLKPRHDRHAFQNATRHERVQDLMNRPAYVNPYKAVEVNPLREFVIFGIGAAGIAAVFAVSSLLQHNT